MVSIGQFCCHATVGEVIHSRVETQTSAGFIARTNTGAVAPAVFDDREPIARPGMDRFTRPARVAGNAAAQVERTLQPLVDGRDIGRNKVLVDGINRIGGQSRRGEKHGCPKGSRTKQLFHTLCPPERIKF